MRVFGRALVLGFMVIGCAPSGVSAAPIVAGLTPNPDGCGNRVDVTTNCSLFGGEAIASGDPFTIDFNTAGDVALFEFTFSTDTYFSVTTDPFWTDLTGPFFGVFNPLSLDSNGVPLPDSLKAVTFAVPGDPDASIPALQDVLATPDPASPDFTPLLFTQGSYLFALIGPSNFFHDSLAAGFDLDSELLNSPCEPGAAGCRFTVAFNTTPVETPAPVPEPGTLTLMAGGAIAGLIQRRRLKKRNRAESVSR
jgi:PEP-CTERM motif